MSYSTTNQINMLASALVPLKNEQTHTTASKGHRFGLLVSLTLGFVLLPVSF